MLVKGIVPRGYCKGVVRAIEIAKKQAHQTAPVYILGMIVHNQYIVNALEDLGIQTIDFKGKTRLELLDEINEGKVIITAHGASQKVFDKAKEKNLEDKYSIEFLPFGLGLKELDRFDVVILCPHLKVELDRALKNQTIDKPLYLLPPKMYGLMKFDEIIVDIEDVMKMYQENPVVPVKFPGEDNLLRITRGVAYRHAHPLK